MNHKIMYNLMFSTKSEINCIKGFSESIKRIDGAKDIGRAKFSVSYILRRVSYLHWSFSHYVCLMRPIKVFKLM